MSCYFHDISLITYPDVNIFEMDKGKMLLSTDRNKQMIEAYKQVDSYFENKIRITHSKDSAFLLRTASEFDFLDNSTRDLVAAISQAHGENAEDVYVNPGDNKMSVESVMTRTHITHLKSILRLADSLDITQDRVSPFYLSKNFPLMPVVSRFHWISHLAVNSCSLVAEYKSLREKGSKIKDSFLSSNNLQEHVTLAVNFNTGLDLISKKPCKSPCKRINIEKKDDSYHLTIGGNNCTCITNENCPLLCKWMHCKNQWINEELLHIADMSNHDDNRIFTTDIAADYVLDKNKSIVDKYIPFIEDYLTEVEKVTKEDFDKALEKLDKAIKIVVEAEKSIKTVREGKTSTDNIEKAMDNLINARSLSEDLTEAMTNILEISVNLIGKKKFESLRLLYSKQYNGETKDLISFILWYQGFMNFIKEKCGLFK